MSMIGMILLPLLLAFSSSSKHYRLERTILTVPFTTLVETGPQHDSLLPVRGTTQSVLSRQVGCVLVAVTWSAKRVAGLLGIFRY